MKNKYRGTLGQIPIYLGKCFRSFLFMDDWKVLPISAVIAGLVALVGCQYIFVTMEGTTCGAFALVCVCIWNGMFNSIQVVCRERNVVKREHRSGMHISSYIISHMIYQAFLCLMQTVITIGVCFAAGLHFPAESFVTGWFLLDLGITFFLITFTADMLSLMISCIVSTPTTAMTMIPFVLIIQLLFSGTMFQISAPFTAISQLTISKWGMECVCSIGNFNSLPMVSLWNQIFAYRSLEVGGQYPVKEITDYMARNGLNDVLMQKAGEFNANPAYAPTAEHITKCWGILLLFAVLYAVIAIIFLSRIDRDKR